MQLPYDKLRALNPGTSPFRLKGNAYKGVLAVIDKEVGLATIVPELPEQMRAFFQQRFIAAEWYDVLPFPVLTDIAARRAKQDHEAYVSRLCSVQAEADMRGPYKLLFRMLGSPELVANRFALATRQYFDFGGAENTTVEPGHLVLHRTGVPTLILPWYEAVALAYMHFAMRLVRTKQWEIRVVNDAAGKNTAGYATTDFDFDLRYR